MKVKFLNWWSDGRDDFFYLFVKNYIDSNAILSEDPDILFCSVFGERDTIVNYLKTYPNIKCKIFFTGENTEFHPSHNKYDDYMKEHMDICLGFKKNNGKILRFPLWLTYINFENNMGKKCYNFKELLNKNNNSSREKFCCMLSNVDYDSMYRTKIFNILSTYKIVDSAGKLHKNVNYIVKRGEENKKEWLQNYKFNICFENSLSPGYTTEKLLECLMAGCIPIYFGDNPVDDQFFNQEAIINLNCSNFGEKINLIVMLDKDQQKYEEFRKKPVINDDAIQFINRKYSELLLLIKKLLK